MQPYAGTLHLPRLWWRPSVNQRGDLKRDSFYVLFLFLWFWFSFSKCVRVFWWIYLYVINKNMLLLLYSYLSYLSRDGIVSLSIGPPLGLDWNISTIGQTAMQFNTDYFFGTISRSKSLSIHCNNLMFLRWICKKFFTDIHASQRMHPFLIPLSSITPMRLTSFGFSEISWQLLDEFLPLCWANKSLGFFSNSIIRSKFYFAQ